MSKSHGSAPGPSAPAPSPGSGLPIQPALVRELSKNGAEKAPERGTQETKLSPAIPSLTKGQISKVEVETTAPDVHGSATRVAESYTAATRVAKGISCAQPSTKNKSVIAKGKEVFEKTITATPEIDISSVIPIESKGPASEAVKPPKPDNILRAKSEVDKSLFLASSDHEKAKIKAITDTKASADEQLDTDTDDDDSLQESDSYCGYEHVSKTILRKSDTVVRNTSKNKEKAIKKDNVDVAKVHVRFREDADTVNIKKDVKETSFPHATREVTAGLKDPADQSVITKQPAEREIKHPDLKSQSITGNGSKQSTKPATDKTSEEASSGNKSHTPAPGKDAAESDVAPASKKSRGKTSPTPARKGKRKTSPSRPLEERLTNTVIRRYVKTKTSEPVAAPVKPTRAFKGDIASKAEPSSQKDPVVSGADKDPSHSDSKSSMVQDSNKTSDSSEIPCKSKVVHPLSQGEAEAKGDPSVSSKKTVVDVLPSPKIGMKSTRADEMLVKGARSEEIAASKTGKPETLPGHGSSTSSPTTKHVSIKDPPESIPRRDSSTIAQSSLKKPVKSALSKDIAGPSQKHSQIESEGEMIEEIEISKEQLNKVGQTNGLVHPKNKSCCFCWCCCCSCSCLSVNNHKRNQNMKSTKHLSASTENYFHGEEPTPTLEEIRLWGESFDKLMKCSAGRKVFREFLQCEYSEENILFWLACEDLKKETKAEVIEQKSRIIYEDFISILSPREVSLDSKVRDVINKNIVNPTTSTFDEAQLQIYTLMHRDSYPRFVNSAMFRKLAQLPAPSRKGSMA